MLTLDLLTISSGFFWLVAFIDASVVAIIATITIRFLLYKKAIHPDIRLTREALFFQSALIVFGIEAMLMMILPLSGMNPDSYLTVLLNAVSLALLSSVLIHYYLLIPPSKRVSQFYKPDKSRITSTVISSYLFGLCMFIFFLLNIYQQQAQSHIKQVIEREQQLLVQIRSNMQRQMAQASLDVKMLAMQQNLQQVLAKDSSALYEASQDYLNLALIKRDYEQIRYIDNRGNEKIRIDQQYNGPFTVAPQHLQNKASRYYFQASQQLQKGEIFISPMDLNIEHGKIELPYKPIVRAVTPVFTHDGQRQGMLIINLNASRLLDNLRQANSTISGEVMLLNEQGYWLYGQSFKSAWAFMFPQFKDRTLQRLNSDAWKSISGNRIGVFESSEGFYIFDTINTGAQLEQTAGSNNHWPSWKLVILLTKKDVSAELNEISQLLFFFFFIVLSVTGTGTYMYYRVQLKLIDDQVQIHHLAHHDSLTGLCNRRLFIEMLELELAHAKRDKLPIAVMYLDLDQFKPINDKFGHDAGDFILREVANRLRKLLRESDTLCRLGGDEFAALLPSPGNKEQLEKVALRILSSLEQPFIYKDNQLNVGISIGIAQHYPGQPLESLLHEADQAMYQSKQAGRNGYSFA